uniref:Uncharacterized protein n=1 Tax=Rhinolophus ferrumequinum TaxID=59479 RepID=A0A671FW46_RHIFE
LANSLSCNGIAIPLTSSLLLDRGIVFQKIYSSGCHALPRKLTLVYMAKCQGFLGATG